MSKATSLPDKVHLIWVEVILFPNDDVTYSYFEFVSGRPLPSKVLRVRKSDLLGFFVSVLKGNRRSFPPYRITFEDDGLLGERIVDVTEGGPSSLFPIQRIRKQDRFKYEVSLPTLGIDPDDPEIQMDSTAFEASDVSVTIYARHDVSQNPPFVFSTTPTGDPVTEFSLHAKEGITWELRAAQQTGFQVRFKPRPQGTTQYIVAGGGDGVDGDVPVDESPIMKTAERTAVELKSSETYPATFIFRLTSNLGVSQEIGIKLQSPLPSAGTARG